MYEFTGGGGYTVSHGKGGDSMVCELLGIEITVCCIGGRDRMVPELSGGRVYGATRKVCGLLGRRGYTMFVEEMDKTGL